jgi:hypothetical protein
MALGIDPSVTNYPATLQERLNSNLPLSGDQRFTRFI